MYIRRTLLFNFKLLPILRESASDSLYMLSNGLFWLKVGSHELFRYTDAIVRHWSRGERAKYGAQDVRTCHIRDDYMLLYHHYHNALPTLSAVLAPVPAELIPFIRPVARWVRFSQRCRRLMPRWGGDFDGFTRFGDDVHAATRWTGERFCADAGYLRYPFDVWAYRFGDTVTLCWHIRNHRSSGHRVWAAPATGEITMTADRYLREVTSFHDRLMRALDGRIGQIERRWTLPRPKPDTDDLRRQLDVYRKQLQARLDTIGHHKPDYAWSDVLAGIERVQRFQRSTSKGTRRSGGKAPRPASRKRPRRSSGQAAAAKATAGKTKRAQALPAKSVRAPSRARPRRSRSRVRHK